MLRHGAGADSGEQPGAQDCAEGSSRQEQESSPQLAFTAWDHQGNTDINEKRVLGVCVSDSSLSPALQSRAAGPQLGCHYWSL